MRSLCPITTAVITVKNSPITLITDYGYIKLFQDFWFGEYGPTEGALTMFEKGKINISVQRTNYVPGDMISGNVSLTLKKPVKARELSISFIGEKRSTSVGIGKGSSTTTQATRVYDFKQQLDGEKEYVQGGEYPFEIKIPADILGSKQPLPELDSRTAQGLAIVQGIAQMVGAFQPTMWYLLAKLDIPGGMDIKRTTDITLG
jgi:hypothetical protein